MVDGLAQGLAGLEMRYALFWDLHRLAAARVAAQPWRSVTHREAAKAADLDAMSAHQGVAHGVQNGFDGGLGVALGQMIKECGQFFEKIGSGHGV